MGTDLFGWSFVHMYVVNGSNFLLKRLLFYGTSGFLVIQAAQDSPLLDRGIIQILSHPIDRLLHARTHLRTRLEIHILVLVNNEERRPIESRVRLDKPPASDPPRILLHERDMFLEIPLLERFLGSLLRSNPGIHNHRSRLINPRLAVCIEQLVFPTTQLDFGEDSSFFLGTFGEEAFVRVGLQGAGLELVVGCESGVRCVEGFIADGGVEAGTLFALGEMIVVVPFMVVLVGDLAALRIGEDEEVIEGVFRHGVLGWRGWRCGPRRFRLLKSDQIGKPRIGINSCGPPDSESWISAQGDLAGGRIWLSSRGCPGDIAVAIESISM
jgi:hypothetical protein